MRILLAVPTFENITPDTYKALWDLDRCGHEVIFEFVRGYDCAHARTKIAQRAIELRADWLLMVDNDVTLPPDALANLLSHDVDVCLGWYAHRGAISGPSGKTSLCKLDGEISYTHQYSGDELRELASSGQELVQVHGGGLGCALIRVALFDRLSFPWFDWVTYPDGHGVLSEDLYFCECCKFARVPVHADPRVACGHLFREIVHV